MSWIAFIYCGDEILEAELREGQTVTIGSGPSDGVRLEGLGARQVSLTAEGGVLRLAPGGQTLASGGIARVSGSATLTVFEKLRGAHTAVSLAGVAEVSIGRSGRKDISIPGGQVSSNHATLRKTGGGWEIFDDGSRNGTFVDGKRVSRCPLRDGAAIFIGGWKLRYTGGGLRIENALGGAVFSPKLRTSSEAAAPEARGAADTAYPYFQRSPRIVPEAGAPEVDILSPPRVGDKPSVSWLSILLPPSLMIAVMVAAALAMNAAGSGGGFQTLLFTVPMSAISVVVSIINYNSQVKKWRAGSQAARDKYAAYLAQREAEISAAESAYAAALNSVDPGLEKCVAIAAGRERRLWERSVSDGDFLAVRVGSGTVPSNVSVKLPHAQMALEEDPLLAQAQELKARHGHLSGIPVTAPFASVNIAGLTGEGAALQRMVWAIVCGVATHHSYEDVKIAAVFPESDKGNWDFMRWLPHVWDDERRERLLACTESGAAKLLRGLDDTLKARARDARDEGDAQARGKPAPHYFIILADKRLVERTGVSLLPGSPALSMTVVYAYGDMGRLPGECGAIIECGGKSGALYDKSAGGGRAVFAPDKISRNMMDRFCRILAPVRFRAAKRAAAMPEYVPLLAGFGAGKTEELDVIGRWRQSRPFESIAAPIGVRENGETFSFDIHERGMGPHGIVAGATRWGKSETLTTWLLSVALNYHPQEVSFVLIDFKGDGLSGILMDLPHVAGKISNVNDIASIERNLRSLQGELLRRQRVFMETRQENIHKYQEAFRGGRVGEPLPYLIIVIDEFAELKTQFPEQMNNFIQIARVGGSLGVYMVLATQSPGGGVVSGQVSANSRFRICLKTAEASESRDIIGTADAFQITVRGRAYVKVGNNEVYEQVQTFFSKAPYNPGAGGGVAATKINIVELDGGRSRPEVYDKTVGARGPDFSEGRAVADHIKETAARAGVVGARQVWTEALPERVALPALIGGREAFADGRWQARNDGLSVVAGLVDDPDNQRQYPLVLDFGENGHQAVYGAPQSGKTEFLRTALLSAAYLYTPEQLQIVVMEFGTSVMKPLEALPHTLLVTNGIDIEAVEQTENFLTEQLADRRRRFSEQGVATLDAYRDITGRPEPALLIAIDNMASLYNMYPDLMDTVALIAREGAGFGIYMLMTASGQGSFMYRAAQYIKCSYALQLTDKADYRQLVGGNGRAVPGRFPGRGFANGPLEFQTALFSDSAKEAERIKRLREVCAEMSGAWQGAKPDIARAVSGEIDAEQLAFGLASVQIGVDRRSGEPFEFVFDKMNACVITGADGSGKTNALARIVTALAANGDTALYIYEKGDTLGAISGRAAVPLRGSELDRLIREIADMCGGSAESGGARRAALVIDDFTQFYDEIADETADRLDVIIKEGAQHGIYIYIAGGRAGLQRLANLSLKTLMLCLDKGNAIALGGRLGDYGLFGALHSAGDAVMTGREGCVIAGGKATAVKFAKVRGAAKNA
ncbi:MAG: type VII secretion protein EssC [Oscillospiraceae bacterium]|jgi:S-DNA-T family DNA segregation ATPase FtsK/SpoIIIE|nr:type VII secretion protein EssC [Oscillospiraceae bacterium]